MATHRDTRPYTIATASILAIAVAAVIGLLAITPAAGGGGDDAGRDDPRALVTDVDPMAVDVFVHHAADLEPSDWCDVLAAHHDDWDGFRASIADETDRWATDEVGLLAQVGVAMAATCPGEVAAFAAGG